MKKREKVGRGTKGKETSEWEGKEEQKGSQQRRGSMG
jgi:hypothetical protein